MVLSMNRWKGKVAIVTGASAGCGYSIAEQLVDNGVLVSSTFTFLLSAYYLSKKYCRFALKGCISKTEHQQFLKI